MGTDSARRPDRLARRMAAVTIAPMQAAVPRSSAFKVSVTAISAAVLLGIVLGVLSTHEDLGNLVRIGTPWVTAAFALGALVGWQTRAWTAAVAALAAVVMIDPLITQALLGDRQFAPATIVVQMLIGLSLPFLLLPRARRRGGHC